MRAYAQPNGRFDLITYKHTLPGSKHEPCPFPGSYAPATVRYMFTYLLPPGGFEPSSADSNPVVIKVFSAGSTQSVLVGMAAGKQHG